jgi:hypothetical protein
VTVSCRDVRVGEPFAPSSEDERKCPFDRDVYGLSFILIFESASMELFSSSLMVPTEIGFPKLGLDLPDPTFLSVSGGLGGAFGGCVREAVNFSLDAFRSVVGGVNIFSDGRTVVPTASRLCSLEKTGYGRLERESDFAESSSDLLGIERRLFSPEGEIDVLDEDFSLVETLR